MLSGKMVRVRYARDRILPHYLDDQDENWLDVAEQMLCLYRDQEGRTRGELEQELEETFGNDPGQLVHQGLAKLLEDRCEFETVAGHPPEELREAAFAAATAARQGEDPFDRDSVLAGVAAALGLPVEEVDRGLFADLKSEQHLIAFKDISAERLLERYNVALAQAVLLRSTRVQVTIRNEPPARYRQLLRQAKFRRLICEVEKVSATTQRLHLDGPLSLFSSTNKYGLQLALFFPVVLLCHDYEVKAELRWGAQRKPKTFTVTPKDGLRSHLSDSGMYVPPEIGMFLELFRKRVEGWEISEETEIYPLGDGFWVPDFRLTHKASGKSVLLEVLGFWRRGTAEKHLERLRRHAPEPFLLAVSDQLHIEEAELETLPAGIHRFRNMPLPDEIARLAGELLSPDLPLR
jgi:predicted nuclease of restriction endonuclease-like RecB superfamily